MASEKKDELFAALANDEKVSLSPKPDPPVDKAEAIQKAVKKPLAGKKGGKEIISSSTSSDASASASLSFSGDLSKSLTRRSPEKKKTSSSSSSLSGSYSYSTSSSEKKSSSHEKRKKDRELEKVVQKARLLARIEQLSSRQGARPSATFGYEHSEDELLKEIARLEIQTQRNIRIKQARGAWITFVAGTEKTGKAWDANFGDKWFSLQFDGITKDVVLSITDYDDCLEEAMEDMFGTAGHIPWYYRLPMIFGSALVNRSIMNRFKDNPEHTKEVLDRDPELRKEVAKEIVRTNQQRAQEIDALNQNQQTNTRMPGDDVSRPFPISVPVARPRMTGPLQDEIRVE